MTTPSTIEVITARLDKLERQVAELRGEYVEPTDTATPLCDACHGSHRCGCEKCRIVEHKTAPDGTPTFGFVSLLGPCLHCGRDER